MLKISDWLIYFLIIIVCATIFLMAFMISTEDTRYLTAILISTPSLFMIVSMVPFLNKRVFPRRDGTWGVVLVKIILIAALIAYVAIIGQLSAPIRPCDQYREARKSCAAAADFGECMGRMNAPKCPSEELQDSYQDLGKAQREFIDRR